MIKRGKRMSEEKGIFITLLFLTLMLIAACVGDGKKDTFETLKVEDLGLLNFMSFRYFNEYTKMDAREGSEQLDLAEDRSKNLAEIIEKKVKEAVLKEIKEHQISSVWRADISGNTGKYIVYLFIHNSYMSNDLTYVEKIESEAIIYKAGVR